MKGKLKDIQVFLLVLVAVLLLNWLGSSIFFRIDMTEDDRYSLSPSTIRVVEDMKGEVEVEIFLHGDFPAQYKILEQSIEEKLQDLKAYAGGDLSYYFTDPFAITDKKQRTELLQSLQQRGIVPISLNDSEEGKRVEKLIFPGAIVRFGQRELAVNFVKGMMMDGDNGKIQEAVQGIEYELVHSLKTIMQQKRKRVAFLLGHGELDQRQVQDLVANLSPNYDVGFFNLSVNPSIDSIDAIVVAQPTQSFSPIDQYKIDQFIMKGGKALFFLDMVETRKDTSGMVGLPYHLKLEDLLFKYGIRINEDLIKDLYGAPVPVRVSGQYKLVPWGFNPILSNFNQKHPISRNMGDVYGKNVGTIDTVFAPGVIKTPLMFTSSYVLKHSQPVVFSPEELRFEPRKEAYPTGDLAVSYLLEGSLKSLYTGRPLPAGADRSTYVDHIESGQVIVASDGDLIANAIDQQTGKPYQLGFDLVSRQQFANKDFAMNCVNYLLDEDGVIDLKMNVQKLRQLDKFKVKEDRVFWQVTNVVVPILVIVLFGLVQFFLRKRKNTKF